MRISARCARFLLQRGALRSCAVSRDTCPRLPATNRHCTVQDNVWLGLTVEEVVGIREWLLDPAQGFNLTRGEKAKIKCVCGAPVTLISLTSYSDNFVEVVEAIPPPKADALAFYKGGPKPARFARAVLSFGGHAEPTVQNMRVGPLPISKSTKAVPHSEIYHRPVVPHNSRTMTVRKCSACQ